MSGTNSLHGRVRVWHQNSALGAREFFRLQSQTVGRHRKCERCPGPIKKDRGGSSLRQTSEGSEQAFYLQTVLDDLIAGALLGTADPSQARDVRDPIPGLLCSNIIPRIG